MGSKPKFWFRIDGDDAPWLFKEARFATGEAWAEKIASEIARAIGLPAATVELACFGKIRGVAVRSVVPPDGELIHGNEVMAMRWQSYDRAKRFGQAEHTWSNIRQALTAVFEEDVDAEIERFCGLLVLDALIGNTDRHHENWAMLAVRARETEPARMSISPSFDHASSLGRELTDARREEILASNRVAWYLERGTGGIYWTPVGRHGENPLRLTGLASAENPAPFLPWIERLRKLEDHSIFEPIRQVPDDWMTATSKRFCGEFLRISLDRLRRLTP
jgi:hypothetical protein